MEVVHVRLFTSQKFKPLEKDCLLTTDKVTFKKAETFTLEIWLECVEMFTANTCHLQSSPLSTRIPNEFSVY